MSIYEYARRAKEIIMKRLITLEGLPAEAKAFCEQFSLKNHVSLLGVTDGKAVGTYVENAFVEYLSERYALTAGSSAKGIDLPDEDILLDIKATSVTQPQSSCPFKNARQKIYGLGYNLLIFVYEKQDTHNNCALNFRFCAFIDRKRTADYTTSKRLREMLDDGARKEDIIAYLHDRNLPGDDITYSLLADEILANPPEQGYLTISNALQWRLHYMRALTLSNMVEGVTNYVW